MLGFEEVLITISVVLFQTSGKGEPNYFMMELFKYDKDDATTSSMTEITGSFCFGGTDDLY